ncbi:putative glutamyl-tRNA amidotransferase subunit A [Lineolata rhizophorae]|uniref:amidase n=1 Tax=Lineolata rhizophorae TaxID=578093 RepID=A0A6A6NRZ9_9PEZI|nr:putative glutamyl-tRNA amidotransferase subunit A [Lineolata rhizophorae]
MPLLPFERGKTSWEDVVKAAQAHRDETIAAVEPPVPDVPAELPLDVTPLPRQLLSAREVELTETPPEELAALLAKGQLTSVELTKAFLRRAGLAQKLTNCVTELLPNLAIQRATALDAYLAQHGTPIGPLHGLPISIKEHASLAGHDVNAGFVSWVGRPAPSDSAGLLQLLDAAGAVFYARTTQPQTLMHLETSSNLYGATVNPFRRSLTSGGSSGGEGALLGLRASCLGVGTDIGGSIRSPAANQGLFGLKPSSYRLPMEGMAATMMGQEQIVPVIGPLSTSLEGVRLFMRACLRQRPWVRFPSLLPLPWREGEGWERTAEGGCVKKLKVGVLWDDGVVRVHPPVRRALKETVDALKKVEGVEIVEWKPYKHDLAWEIIASLYFCDGASEESEAIAESGEPWRPLSEFIIKQNPFVKKLSVSEIWDWTQKREEYRAAYAQRWNDTATRADENGVPTGAVDVILCPVGPGAAPLLETAKYWGYTSQWNLLDYSALVFPVTKVDPTVDVKEETYNPRNEKDEYNYNLCESTPAVVWCVAGMLTPLDDPENFAGAPISLQLVGRRYEEEKVVEIMEYIISKTGLPFKT